MTGSSTAGLLGSTQQHSRRHCEALTAHLKMRYSTSIPIKTRKSGGMAASSSVFLFLWRGSRALFFMVYYICSNFQLHSQLCADSGIYGYQHLGF